MRPVLTYVSETWVLSKADERSFGLFERRVLRCIFGAVQDKGTWRKRYNYELYKLFNEPDIIKRTEFLATYPEVLGSIPGASRFSEKQWVWNGVHSAS
jgi:hypothetical protein